VKLAQQACELTQYKQPRHICTLAAAYAETGRYDVALLKPNAPAPWSSHPCDQSHFPEMTN